jgi:hypothetical protein
MKLFKNLSLIFVLVSIYVKADPNNSASTTPLAPISLCSAGDFAILTASGISTTGTTTITGNIGVTPIAATAMTGFGLVLDSSTTFSTSSLVDGLAYAADYGVPTPARMTTAMNDFRNALVEAMGVPNPDHVELGAGTIGGLTLQAGLYKWTSTVNFLSDITLNGNPDSVFIFQIDGTLVCGSGVTVWLTGGQKASNIFWRVSDVVALEPGCSMHGTILAQTMIAFKLDSSLNGAAYAGTAVTIIGSTISKPTQYPTYCSTDTDSPSLSPSTGPTKLPTSNPTLKPTSNPTLKPTQKPTYNPTKLPTSKPTQKPTKLPTQKPTYNPTYNPTKLPTSKPTQKPTKLPTLKPTQKPTYNPTKLPTQKPTYNPTKLPTLKPTQKQTSYLLKSQHLSQL